MKLDLHTHVFEEFLPVSPRAITIRSVERLVEAIKKAGLDGIAVTEHNTKAYGYRVKEIVETHFDSEVVVIPGREVHSIPIHFVELDLPCDGIFSFRFLAHPGYPGDSIDNIASFDGIEIENAAHNWHIDREKVKNIAVEHNLVLLSNSDAHSLADIGRCYSEISLEDLCRSCHTTLPTEPI